MATMHAEGTTQSLSLAALALVAGGLSGLGGVSLEGTR